MEQKAPTLLVVQVETAKLRWFVAGLGLEGQLVPLICSDEGDLEPYRTLEFDEQVAFLRHRFCGVLQRGCYRLWEQQKKACQFVILFEGALPDSTGPLTRRFGEHLAEWMNNPPVVVFTITPGSHPEGNAPLSRLAGELEPGRESLLLAHLRALNEVRSDPDAWQQVRQKGSWVQRSEDAAPS